MSRPVVEGKRGPVRVAAPPEAAARADALAARHGLARAPEPAPYELWCGPAGPVLRRSDPAVRGPAVRSALHVVRRGRDPLLRAVAGRRGGRSDGVVADATAGLGADAGALAEAGWRVEMFERAPFLAALLEEGLEALRRSEDPRLRERAARMRLHAQDAEVGLPALSLVPAVVLLDPMYPRSKGGAKGAGIDLLRELLGPPDDAEAKRLLRAAQAVARRVVVKRPRKAPPLAAHVSGSILGRTTRFDLYAGAQARA